MLIAAKVNYKSQRSRARECSDVAGPRRNPVPLHSFGPTLSGLHGLGGGQLYMRGCGELRHSCASNPYLCNTPPPPHSAGASQTLLSSLAMP